MKKYLIGTILAIAFIVFIVGGFNSLMNKNQKLTKDNTILTTQVNDLQKANESLIKQVDTQKQIGQNNAKAVSGLSKQVIKNNNESNKRISVLREKAIVVNASEKSEEEKALEVSMLVFESIQRPNKVVETQKAQS